jgi:hypothetical protein
MIGKIVTFMTAALPILLFAAAPSAAMAQNNYSGNWPATVTGTRFSNGTYCLTLSQSGSFGGAIGGSATWISNGEWVGEFLVIDGVMMVQIFVTETAGQIGAQVWTARANAGNIGSGVFAGVAGDNGKVVFGAKNSCTPAE